MIDNLNGLKRFKGTVGPNGTLQVVPLTAIRRHSRSRVRTANIMRVIIFQSVFILGLIASSNTAPAESSPKTFFLDAFTKGFTISRVTDDNQAQQPANGYQVRFVPLISLLAGMFPNFLNRLGQFSGVNKVTATNNRRFPVADKSQENSITAPPLHEPATSNEESEEEEETDDDYIEKELIECDGNHLGLWPDRTDPQRYYKCEVDPRTSPTTNCIKEMIQQESGKDLQTLERIEVPGVKPCYLLSMLKCANGFKYQHSTRICVPDIVFAHRH